MNALISIRNGGSGLLDRLQQLFIGSAGSEEQFDDEEGFDEDDNSQISEDYTEEGVKRYHRAGRIYIEEPPILYPDTDTGRYEYKKIDSSLYWVRHIDTNRRFMLVSEEHPLMNFCRSLAQYERGITETISPESGDVLVPGIIGYFVERIAPKPSEGYNKVIDDSEGDPQDTGRYQISAPPAPQPQKMTTNGKHVSVDVRADMPQFELPSDELINNIQSSSNFTHCNDISQQEHLKALPHDMSLELQVAEDRFLRNPEKRWYSVSSNHYAMFRSYIQHSSAVNSALLELSSLKDNTRMDTVLGKEAVRVALQKAQRSTILIERLRQAAIQASIVPSADNVAELKHACNEFDQYQSN